MVKVKVEEMKRLLVGCLLSFVLPLAGLADVEYLNWMVDQSEAESQTPFSYAVLAVLGEDGKEVGYVMSPGDITGTQVAAADATGINTTGEKLTGAILEEWQGAAYSFQLELYNSDWQKIDYSSAPVVTYESLVYARFPGGDVGTHTWNAIGPAPVPEPTGGTLALLGLAFLGLRRKRFGMSEAAT